MVAVSLDSTQPAMELTNAHHARVASTGMSETQQPVLSAGLDATTWHKALLLVMDFARLENSHRVLDPLLLKIVINVHLEPSSSSGEWVSVTSVPPAASPPRQDRKSVSSATTIPTVTPQVP